MPFSYEGPTKCWFVEGETVIDDLDSWKREHSEFVNWDVNWFTDTFVRTGELIASDSDDYGCAGGSLLLFQSPRSAELYASRDAAIASGRRKIIPALFACIQSADEEDFEDLTAFELADEEFRDVFWSASGLAAFEGEDGWYLVFPDNEVGRQGLESTLCQLQTATNSRRPL